MSSFEKLKLSKQLQIAVSNAGYVQPTQLQSKIFGRINGGQDFVAVAPEGAGKTTSIVLAALNKLKFTEEIAPRVLILVPDIERGEALLDQFHTLNRNRNLRIYGLFATETSIDTQVLEVTDGVDIIVATPDRARSVYLKLGLNLNKIQLFVVDDAEEIIKKGLQLPVVELGRGIPKAQQIIFTTVYHSKIEKMLEYIMEFQEVIEVEEDLLSDLNTTEQVLYTVPNFKTKLNLLVLLLNDKEVFDKAVVFVNSKFTAETVYKALRKYHLANEIAIYKDAFLSEVNIIDENDFRLNPHCKILIVAEEDAGLFAVQQIPFVFHFDIPEDMNAYMQRVVIKAEEQNEQISLTLCTELELSDIKKIEQKIGKKMSLIDLPGDLYIEKTDAKKRKAVEEEEVDLSRGGAFHEKKAKNRKPENIKPSVKAKEKYKNK